MQTKRNFKTNNKVFVLSYQDFTGIAALTGSKILRTLPAGSVIKRVLLKHTVQWAAPSLSALTARVTTANHNYGTAFNIFTAPTAEGFDSDLAPFREKLATPVDIKVDLTATGANLNTFTAGELQVILTYDVEATV